nr:MAG TPA: hypothetical protein [Microviridae sp.]
MYKSKCFPDEHEKTNHVGKSKLPKETEPRTNQCHVQIQMFSR